MEEVLTALVADLLKLPAVGRHDSFFSLGGDSISSIVLVSAARRGLVISPRDVFEQRTVAALARVARREETAALVHDPGGAPCRSPLSCTRCVNAAATTAASTSPSWSPPRPASPPSGCARRWA